MGYCKMKKIIYSAILALSLTACQPGNIIYKDVPTPVYVVPHPNKPARPKLAVEGLTRIQQEDPGMVVKADAASVEQLKGYVLQLEAILDKYEVLATESEKTLAAAAIAAGKTPEKPKALSSMTTDEWKKLFQPNSVTPPTPQSISNPHPTTF